MSMMQEKMYMDVDDVLCVIWQKKSSSSNWAARSVSEYKSPST